ncbi:hypothetical protein BGX27_010139 [Mortierella sp. AM989]|nr:hypothetical protein BGX27_010139 [Mortierella sp. AM989]
MIRTPSARQKSDVVIKMETLDEGSISHQAGSSEQERMSLLDADEAAVSTPRQSSGQQLLGTLERRKTKFDEKQYRSLSIKHTLSGGQIPSGHYYVTLSISLDRMDPSYIEDIKFTYTSGNTTKEIQLSASELKGLEQKSDQRIRIHYGLDIQTHHDCSIDIAISFKDNASKTPSTIRLNYLELIDAYSQLPSKDDYVVFGSELVNSPTSIQVCQEDSEMSEQPVQIKAICVSNSEKHIATLSMDSGDAIVKVWSLESEETDENKGKKENFDCTLTKRITLASQDLAKYPNISLALSEDGTDVVVCQAPSDGELISLEEDLIGFNGSPIKRMGPVRRKFFSFLSRKVNNPITTCLGYGKFMVPSSNEELFLQTDGNSILIHQIRPIWTIVFCFALSNTIPPTWGTVKSCIESANGPYFAWVGDRRAVSIWRVDRGLMVSFIPTSHFHQDSKLLSSEKSVARAKYQQPRCNITRFSCCGRAVAVVNGYKVHVFLMPSATEAKVLDTRALGSNITIVDVIWAKSLPKLSVLFRDNNEHKEYLVSFSDGNVVWSEERSVCSGAFATPHVTNTRTYTTHGSTLDICDIEALRKTRTFGPSLPEINTKGCRQNLGSPIAGKSECDMDNGMSFRIEADETSGVSELVMVAPNGARRTYLRFPITSESLRDDQNGKSNTGPILKASFLNCNTRFVVSGADIVMVWKLPSDQDGQCELIAVKKTDFDPVESAGTSAHDRWLNQELKINNVISSIDTEPLKSTDYINIQECEKAFPELVKFYTDSIISTENWKDWQEALLRYVSRHLTSCSAWDNSSNMFLRKLCQTWELDGYEQRIALLLSDLLLSQDLNVRWLPASASNPDNNPIYYALELYRDHYHRSPTLHSILIDHCFKNTRQLNDIFYLTPVLSCSQLLTLIDKDLALDISRRVAYIPVKDQEDYRSFILDNATDYRGPLNFNIEINFPIRVHYGKDGIYSSRRELEKPSLRLCTPQALNHQAKYFKGKLYIAPISVLWTIQQLEPEKAITETHVHGHNFSLEAFDNPAIEAALEYKWVRFL